MERELRHRSAVMLINKILYQMRYRGHPFMFLLMPIIVHWLNRRFSGGNSGSQLKEKNVIFFVVVASDEVLGDNAVYVQRF